MWLGARPFSSEDKEIPELIEVPEISKCYYQTLGIEKDANTLKVREAYLALARQYHPDKIINAIDQIEKSNPEQSPEYYQQKKDEALKYFTHVSKAYETLADDHQRAIYDEEQITDEEFFRVKMGPITINILYVFMTTVAASATYMIDRKTGIITKYVLGKQASKFDPNACPIDHTKRTEMIEEARTQRK